MLPNEPDLGSVGNTVVRLCRPLTKHVNHILYFDNYYTTMPLLNYLERQGIHALCTVRVNRFGKHCQGSQKKLLPVSVPRGSYLEQITDYDGVRISAVCWKDNKVVTLASTYVGAEPVKSIQRCDKKNKEKNDD